MKHIKLFTERYQPSIIDILTDLKDYFINDGTYTGSLLEYSFIGNSLYIEFDIPSAFDGGRTERDRIKGRLKSFGFEWSGDGSVGIDLSDDDLKKAKDFFNSLINI